MEERHVNSTPRYDATIATMYYGAKNGQSKQSICWWTVYDTANGRTVARGVVIVDKDLETAWHEADKAVRQAIEADINTVRVWPKPTVPRPSAEAIMEALTTGACEATDGCTVEPDGICEHGHPSWLLRLGLI